MTSDPASTLGDLLLGSTGDLLLAAAAARHGAGPASAVADGPLRAGVDLGTATTVLVVLDVEDVPVWVESLPGGAVRDGVVVDFHGAAAAVRRLKDRAEGELGRPLGPAAAAAPPGVPAGDARACRHVCEAAGFEQVALTDEVTAAQQVLALRDGVLVDVGGGSTGAGVFRGGVLVALDDLPGGGHHLDLSLAGALGMTVEQAERHKREHPAEALPLLTPGIERIAESVRLLTPGADDLPVHLAGGGLMLPGAGRIVARYLDRQVRQYPDALLVTPLGIALSASGPDHSGGAG
jgi:ethanolamine utilization protein EutJ